MRPVQPCAELRAERVKPADAPPGSDFGLPDRWPGSAGRRGSGTGGGRGSKRIAGLELKPTGGTDPEWTDSWPVPDSTAQTLPIEQPLVPPSIPFRPSSADLLFGPVARPVPPMNRPVPPVDGPILPTVDGEGAARSAYDAPGMRLGAWRLDTAATAGLGMSSDDGAFWSLGGDLRLTSDFERHGLDLSLRGGTQFYFGDTPDDPAFDARLDGRIDLTEVDRIGLGAGWSLYRQDADDPEVAAEGGVSDVHTVSGAVGYERRAGLIGLDLGATVDRSYYTEDQSQDDTLVAGTLRLSLDNGATLRPFIEGSVFTRIPDDDEDAAGYRRTSVGGQLTAGVAVDTGRLTGELAAGGVTESFDDARLETINAFVAEGDLRFAATPLATMTLRIATYLEPTAIEGASGSVTHEVDAGLSYALRPNIVLDAGAGLSFQDYVGADIEVRTTRLTAGASWRLNPTAELTLSAVHELTDETGEDDDGETTVSVAVTLRR